MSRQFKYSYKQMWSFARKSNDYKTQSKGLRRIYNQKILEAERGGEYGRALYLRSLKSGVRQRLKRNVFPIRKMDGTIASASDLGLMSAGAKEAKQGGMLIFEDKLGTKIIAYEGTEIYDEIIAGKKDIYGSEGKQSLKPDKTEQSIDQEILDAIDKM